MSTPTPAPDEVRAARVELDRGRAVGGREDPAHIAVFVLCATGPDAAARLGGDAARLRADGVDPLTAYLVVSDAMRRVITEPMPKAVASAAVTSSGQARYSVRIAASIASAAKGMKGDDSTA